MKNHIQMFLHCSECLKELPPEESPASWARLNVGLTEIGMQVWCERHNIDVAHFDFKGQQISYADDYKEDV